MRYYWHAIIACLAQSVWLASAVDVSRLLRRAASTPSPISVPPSKRWEGDDGPWSTFTIQVGTPPQPLHVLVSTAGEVTWTVLPSGCSSNDLSCTTGRGGTFNNSTSSTWHAPIPYYNMDIEQNLDYIAYGPVGNDTLSLGTAGPTLTNQAIGGLVAKDFYLGILGLNPRPTNYTTGGEGSASLISSLKAQNWIPSMSLGYTAGNQYRLNAVFGSLTLGGYDKTRFTPNNLSFYFADNSYRDIVVGIQAISSEKSPDMLPDGGITAYVDPTVPHIWLPLTACRAFEKTFNLTYDDNSGRYIINTTTHDNLLRTNANVTFTLGLAQAGGDSINITLPYGSFDLTASWPEANVTGERYFPLRRAANASQYTLGRAFLQEAYLIIDWEHKNFSISQCVFDDAVSNGRPQLVPILSKDAVAIQMPSPAPAKKSSPSTGEIAGIAIGVVVLLALLIGGFVIYKLKQRKRKRSAAPPTPAPPPPDLPMGNTNEHSKPELGTGQEHERYELGSNGASNYCPPPWQRSEKPRDFSGNTQMISVKDAAHPSMPELPSLDPPPPLSFPPVHEMESPSLRPLPHEMESPSLPAVELSADKEPYPPLHHQETDAEPAHHIFASSPPLSPPYRSSTTSPVPRSMGPSPLSHASESPPMHSIAIRPGLASRTSTINSLSSVRHSVPVATGTTGLPSVFSPGPGEVGRSCSLSGVPVAVPVSVPVSPTGGAGAGSGAEGLGITEVMGEEEGT